MGNRNRFTYAVDTKANIEAITSPLEGARAFATDTDEWGYYDGVVWIWGYLNWQDFVPSSMTVNTGGLVSGTFADVQNMFNGDNVIVDEVTGVPGFDIEFGFTNVDRCPTMVIARWMYDGAANHFCTVDIWNYTDSVWDEVRVFSNSNAFFASMTMYLPTVNQVNYVDAGGNAKMRIYHWTSGNSAHDIHIDYIGMCNSLQGAV